MSKEFLDSRFQRPKSEERQKQDVKAETGPRNLAQVVPSVKKRCWADIEHSVFNNGRNEVGEALHVFGWPKQKKHVGEGALNRPNSLTWVVVFRTKFFAAKFEILRVGFCVMCVVWLCVCAFDPSSQTCVRDHCRCRQMLVFSRTVKLGHGWGVVLDDCNKLLDPTLAPMHVIV